MKRVQSKASSYFISKKANGLNETTEELNVNIIYKFVLLKYSIFCILFKLNQEDSLIDFNNYLEDFIIAPNNENFELDAPSSSLIDFEDTKVIFM